MMTAIKPAGILRLLVSTPRLGLVLFPSFLRMTLVSLLWADKDYS